MSENQLHDLLNEMVQVYSQKNQTRIETPAKIGTHLHPLLDRMCEEAEARGASDIIISKGFPPSFKINGTLTIHPHKALTEEETASIAESTMNADQLETFIREREINYSVQSRSNTRYRVNAHYHQGCVGIVLRRINQRIPEMQALGLPEKLKELSLAPRGLLIIAGPTGSGKSTTLAAMINYINETHSSHILTIEDPIEFVHESKKCLINQRELHEHTHSFANALRSALREDPDVILVGEMRDPETIGLALTAAETGHLVFGTLHTTGAAKTVDRIVDVFPAGEKEMVRSMLSESLRAVISQTLLKTRDGQGRVAAHEILISTAAVRNLIRENKIAQIGSALQTGQSHGMQTLDQSLQALVRTGVISQETARAKAQNADFM